MNTPESRSRRQFLKTTSLAVTGAMLPMSTSHGANKKYTNKKGYCGTNPLGLKLIKPHWCYNWWTSGKVPKDLNIEYIPMLKGKMNMNPKSFGTIRANKNAKHLLGYNEPERKKQGDMTVEQGLKHWPSIVELAEQGNLRLGSPGVSGDLGGLTWLEEFMKGAKKQKLRVDFLALHWYGGTDVEKFEDWLDKMYKKYKLPIWVTEFNGWSGSLKEMTDFAVDSFKMLEKHRRVERYAYFSKKKGTPGSIWTKDNKLTEIGEALAKMP